MLRKYLGITGKPMADDFILLILGGAIMCFLAPIVLLKETDMPVTLQSLLAVMIPVLFGWRAGSGSVLLYLVAGAVGLPVFAEYSSGYLKFAGPTGGFLISFLIAAIVTGYLSEKLGPRERLKLAAYIILGYLIILGYGLYWLWGMTEETDKWGALRKFYLPNSFVKAALTFIFVQVAIRMIAGKSEFYNLKTAKEESPTKIEP
jgi:biotin transporter BioY